jgi:hypothetical protein
MACNATYQCLLEEVHSAHDAYSTVTFGRLLSIAGVTLSCSYGNNQGLGNATVKWQVRGNVCVDDRCGYTTRRTILVAEPQALVAS